MSLLVVRFLTLFSLVLAIALLSGCDGGPPPGGVATINPSAAAAQAMNDYDTNKDGALDETELKKCPALTHHPAKFDANGDKRVDAAEITKRLSDIYGQQVGLMNFQYIVHMNGKPLEGAKIKFIPEPFLGAAIKPAEGTRAQLGYTAMSVADSELPGDLRGKVKVMHNGLYKVEITHPTVQIPAIYNTATTLGVEVTGDTAIEPTKVDLKGK
jgi:hypothetical protein